MAGKAGAKKDPTPNKINLVPQSKGDTPSSTSPSSGFKGVKIGPISGIKAPTEGGSGDRLLSNLFDVHIHTPAKDIIVAGFSSVSAISSDTAVEEVYEITHNHSIKTPGTSTAAAVTLNRGISLTSNMEFLLKWRSSILAHTDDKLYGMVIIYPHKRINAGTSIGKFKIVAPLYLHDAWPSSMSFGPWDANSSNILIQSITFEANDMTFDGEYQ